MFETLLTRIREAKTALAEDPSDLSDAQLIDLLREAEELKCSAAAAQAAAAVRLDESQRAAQVAAGLRPERVGEGIAEQIGLARRESASKGARLLGLAKVLEREMPHTLALMRVGRLNEWRATILARETACLPLADRLAVDERLCAEGEAATMSDLGLERAAKALACELDPASVTERARRAESERHVSIRPAPDTMCWVTALLPVKQAVSVYAVLLAAAAAACAQGDERSKGQVMADTLVERVTGLPADAAPRVEVKLVMTDRAFFGTGDDAVHVTGYGPVPAPWARAFVKDATLATRLWVRRLYVNPTTGQLVSMDSRSRLAPAALADFVATRDQDLCRTPWCGAPIRETDHVTAWDDGGPTTAANTQGLCQRCNLAKQAPGWTATTVPDPHGRHTVVTITPTGHRHRSRAPAPPGAAHMTPSPGLARFELTV
ncbi:HNH endonuclease [Nocardioides szechwanensis]|uniref:HNH endonuclease n=1 Tax=Nocardioides szechwanensis TaxID=1005944 RepID=A0A1G9UI39_9ACTN|nr:HNH endonuclease signature motif containing protein [Nocardioides szechwanensis]GEP33248.1 HNH endonuclease [Nocardioides szechwanensis]SDM59589.1 HNH endonuclease [Nocardioides szechwanensis]